MLVNQTKDTVISTDVQLADTFIKRLIGLLDRNNLNENEALLINSSSGIHTFFMKFPIDVLFLNPGLRVLKAVENLVPFRLCFCNPLKTKFVVELPSGTILKAQIQAGDVLILR